jgi:release factor glutamine methyltransferase
VIDTSNNRIHDVLRRTGALLTGFTESPRLDAELLLCEVLHCDRSYLYAHPETCLAREQLASYGALTARRKAGEPIAYIRGFKDFWSLRIRVTPAVLIPRPETELLVELALKAFPQNQSIKVVDLGTGSGAIALAIATERPSWEVHASDTSAAALKVALQNARRMNAHNTTFVVGDWLQPLAGQRYDLILSNPPYVEEGNQNASNLFLEPRSALMSGRDGMDDLNLIIEAARDHLRPEGWLMLEHGRAQGSAVRHLLKRLGYTDVATHLDLAGLERATSSRWSGARG